MTGSNKSNYLTCDLGHQHVCWTYAATPRIADWLQLTCDLDHQHVCWMYASTSRLSCLHIRPHHAAPRAELHRALRQGLPSAGMEDLLSPKGSTAINEKSPPICSITWTRPASCSGCRAVARTAVWLIISPLFISFSIGTSLPPH